MSFTVLSGGETVETTMAEWLPGVVAGEMPADFQPEALKAQAVAARTYALYKLSLGENAAHPQAALCGDAGCCAAYVSPAQLAALDAFIRFVAPEGGQGT